MTHQQNASWQITKPATQSEKGLVAAQSRVAASVGANILSQGGNAIDAAIATSFALGAAEPWMSGMGGGGYMVVHLADDPTPKVIEFGMRAPSELRTDDYPIVGGKAGDLFPWAAVLEDRNVFGAKSVAIPGQVAGMGLAHESFATMQWADLLAPAIALADQGLPVDWYAQLILSSSAKDLAAFPASAETFLNDGIYPKASGWTAINDTRCDFSRLAVSLRTVATDGAQAFYNGPLAETIIADLAAAGGRHTLADLATYKATLVDAHIHPYRDHQIISTPTLTAGPTMNHVLDLLGDWTPTGQTPDAAAYIAYDTAIRAANAHRYATMGDTEHEPDPSCTSHFNVVDSAGNMVSCTQTLLSLFGSRLMLPTSGIMMNNGIMWFDPELGKANSIGPGKRCLANMCPTILSRSDGAMFALGASGGRKIMPSVAQLTSFLLDYGMDLNTAMHTARIDASLADQTIVDDTLPADTLTHMRAALTQVLPAPRTIYPLHYACPSAVSRVGATNTGATEIMAPWADAVAAP